MAHAALNLPRSSDVIIVDQDVHTKLAWILVIGTHTKRLKHTAATASDVNAAAEGVLAG